MYCVCIRKATWKRKESGVFILKSDEDDKLKLN